MHESTPATTMNVLPTRVKHGKVHKQSTRIMYGVNTWCGVTLQLCRLHKASQPLMCLRQQQGS
jgi:hypothetical protein